MSKINTLVIYGDSISTTDYGQGGYQNILCEKLKVNNIFNHAISGSATAFTPIDNFIRVLSDENNIHPEADFIIIWYGTNDWYWGNHLGHIGSNDLSTFSGALDKSLQILQVKCPNAKIILLTPIFRNQAPFDVFSSNLINNAYLTKNKVGHTLKEYKDMLILIAENRCVPVLDIHTLSQINEFNSKLFLEDDVHPSKLGYERISSIIINFIKCFYEN